MAGRRTERPVFVPGNCMKPQETLDWLVERGWFWVNNVGMYGPKNPPTRKADFEAYTVAITYLTASAKVARSRGHYQGQVRFSLRKDR